MACPDLISTTDLQALTSPCQAQHQTGEQRVPTHELFGERSVRWCTVNTAHGKSLMQRVASCLTTPFDRQEIMGELAEVLWRFERLSVVL